MSGDQRSKEVLALCDEVLEQDPADRADYLEARCSGDSELRQAVDSVLIAVSESEDLLEPMVSDDHQSRIGEQIGDFHIIQRLAAGGMGTVYLAERTKGGFHQKVAIKFVHQQILAQEILRRFETERKVLATLQHPYIAQLIDGGTTAGGAPYLIMEYVDGEPIDLYCDNQRLSIQERCRLVQKIALALQAAHQNLVVHRDVKPSNILITSDGIPKLLDFGIAKLLDPMSDSPGHTTVFGHQAMTPDFASPEQILEGRVSTTSDVYSLGILTHQLLTGCRPYELSTRNYREILQFFETENVQTPNQTLETLDWAEREQVAASRKTTTEKLTRELKSDIARVIAKAIATSPDQRYASVREYSEDIERYLTSMPVSARSATFRYRVLKFVMRNKIGVAGASIALTAIAIGLIVSVMQTRVAQEQLQRAEAVSRYLGDILLSASNNWDATIQTGPEATITDILNAAETQLENDLGNYPKVRIELYHKIGEARSRLQDHEAAIRIQDKALQLVASDLPDLTEFHPEALYRKAYALGEADLTEEAIAVFKEAMAIANNISREPNTTKLYILNDLASNYAFIGNFERALELQHQAIADSKVVFGGALQPIHTNGYSNLAMYQFELGKIQEAERSLELGLAAHQLAPQTTSTVAAKMYLTLGRLSTMHLRHQEAEQHFQTAVQLLTGDSGTNPEGRITATAFLARRLADNGRISQAEALIGNTAIGTAKNPDYFEGWAHQLALASLSFARGNNNSAIRHASNALKNKGYDWMWVFDRVETHLLLSAAYGLNEDSSRAQVHLDKARSLASEWLGPDTIFYRNLMRSHERQSKSDNRIAR